MMMMKMMMMMMMMFSSVSLTRESIFHYFFHNSFRAVLCPSPVAVLPVCLTYEWLYAPVRV